MNLLLPVLATFSLGTASWGAASSPMTASTTVKFQPATQIAASRAEDVCESEVRDRGLQVEDVLETNDHSGGTEVIMRVSRRGDDYTVGCDYDDSSRNVELYRIEDDRDNSRYNTNSDRYNTNSDRYDNSDDRYYRSGSGSVSDRREAENIARDAVGEQLDIDDPYSDIVEIRQVEQNGRNWVVEGEANGAPFRVRIRSNDASVEDFQLY
jgi:hypothetical protein